MNDREKLAEARRLLERVVICWADAVDRQRFAKHDLVLALNIDAWLAGLDAAPEKAKPSPHTQRPCPECSDEPEEPDFFAPDPAPREAEIMCNRCGGDLGGMFYGDGDGAGRRFACRACWESGTGRTGAK